MTSQLLLVLLCVACAWPAAAQQSSDLALVPTNHPRLPAEASQFWMAPAPSTRSGAPARARGAQADFVAAVKLEIDANYAKALPLLAQPGLDQGPLGPYAEYYKGLAELRLGRAADARRTFQSLSAKQPAGYLIEASALREAECDEALGDQSAAVEIYDRLSRTKTTAPDDVLMRLGRAARAAGDLDKAQAAFSRAYFEFPFSDLSALAESEWQSLPNVPPLTAGSPRYALELGRAERLFGGKRYAQARTAFESLRGAAQGDDRELVSLRLGECDYFLKRTRNARDEVRPFIDKASRQAEALFFYAVAQRDLGDTDEYMKAVRRLSAEFPDQSWTEEALNNLASYRIVQSDDQGADEAFREMYAKFPGGHYAERAAWKIGWWAYKNGRYAETTSVFESAAARFTRSDYRPSWLYWSARAHDALKETALAESRYTLVAADYLNSYYGRLAVTHLDAATQKRAIADIQPAADSAPPPPALPPNEPTVRALLGLELYDQALDELHYAQKVWGDSSAIQATIGWIDHERGDLRAGINAMKRAYPQYMAAGGEKLPADLLKVLFPVNYWPLIRRYSIEHQLDPYMIAALIAQESTFTADVRSAANAYGLMQIVPATGRQYARALRLAKRFSISLLTTAEPNLKMGTAYFSDLVKQFGGAHFALASYNAGESRVVRWMAERPGIPRDEFIDDIPFPETQAYVKKILGTAEDYRRLYGPDGARSGEDGDADALPAVAHQAKPPVAKKAAVKKPAARKAPARPAAAKKAAPGKSAHPKKSAARKKKSA
jgi:soluble lytic murein transglycosylase